VPSQYIRIQPIKADPDQFARYGQHVHDNVKAWLKGEATRILIGEFNQTVWNWKEAPKFPAEYSEPYGTRQELYVHPVGEGTTNWQRVSDGTGPRQIVSSKGIMKFQPEYVPKTTPGGRYGGPGSKSGPWLQSRVVGTKKPHRIEPREFSKKIKEKVEDKLVAEAQAIIAKALKGR